MCIAVVFQTHIYEIGEERLRYDKRSERNRQTMLHDRGGTSAICIKNKAKENKQSKIGRKNKLCFICLQIETNKQKKNEKKKNNYPVQYMKHIFLHLPTSKKDCSGNCYGHYSYSLGMVTLWRLVFEDFIAVI